MLDRIEKPPAADRVAGLRNSNTLIERPCARKAARKGKIADHPSISLMVVQHKTVTLILAQSARRSSHRQEQRVIRRSIGAIERVAKFIENLDRAVDRLDIMVWADIAIGVGRQTATTTLG